MKKLFLLAFSAMVVVSTLSSCKKDYTCTYTDPSGVSSGPIVVPDATRSDIQELEDAGYTCEVR